MRPDRDQDSHQELSLDPDPIPDPYFSCPDQDWNQEQLQINGKPKRYLLCLLYSYNVQYIHPV
jgi:hypothetical protein